MAAPSAMTQEREIVSPEASESMWIAGVVWGRAVPAREKRTKDAEATRDVSKRAHLQYRVAMGSSRIELDERGSIFPRHLEVERDQFFEPAVGAMEVRATARASRYVAARKSEAIQRG